MTPVPVPTNGATFGLSTSKKGIGPLESTALGAGTITDAILAPATPVPSMATAAGGGDELVSAKAVRPNAAAIASDLIASGLK